MFESSEFLSLYLPNYFERVYLNTHPTQSSQKTFKSHLHLLASFLKFSHQLHTSLNCSAKYHSFLSTHFAILRGHSHPSLGKLSMKGSNQGNGLIMEFIESRIDKVSLTFVQLFLNVLEIQEQLANKGKNKENEVYFERLLKVMNQARLQYEVYRFEVSDLDDYDEFVREIFTVLLQDEANQDMHLIVRLMLESQCSNLGDHATEQIYSLLAKNKSQTLMTYKHETTPDKDSEKWIKNILRSKNKKANKFKGSPLQKKAINFDKKQTLMASPGKNQGIQHRESYSPLNRIQNYMKVKKQKPINKKRTIYYQRKNLHVPKMKEWIDKMSVLAGQINFSSASQHKRTEKKIFKFDNSQSTYQDFDNESMLVRSTPKPTKKLSNLKVISHKLQF